MKKGEHLGADSHVHPGRSDDTHRRGVRGRNAMPRLERAFAATTTATTATPFYLGPFSLGQATVTAKISNLLAAVNRQRPGTSVEKRYRVPRSRRSVVARSDVGGGEVRGHGTDNATSAPRVAPSGNLRKFRSGPRAAKLCLRYRGTWNALLVFFFLLVVDVKT